MAKKFSFSDLDEKLSKIAPLGSIVTKNTFSKIDEWIPTGNYMLNAQITGSLFGGIPNCRSVLIAGDSGCLQKNEKVRIYKSKNKGLYEEILGRKRQMRGDY